MKLAKLGILALITSAVLVACAPPPSSADIQNQRQEALNEQAVREVGLPNITNFFEKRQYKTIYELRDRAVATITYLVDRDGHLHKLCDSVGFGIPYATEFTAPESVQNWRLMGYGGTAYGQERLPQEDPNGLFSPSQAAGTWILCLNPKTRQIAPMYSEPDVLVSEYPVQTE